MRECMFSLSLGTLMARRLTSRYPSWHRHSSSIATPTITIIRLPIRTTNKQAARARASFRSPRTCPTLPATAAASSSLRPKETGTATGSQSHCQTQHHHLHNTLLREACSTTITTAATPLRPLILNNTLTPPPLKQQQAPPPPEQRPYVKHLHTFVLSQPLSSPSPAAVSSRISSLPHKLKLLLLSFGCTPSA